mmetsp:Transcript_127/g.184  ORF Transcript_127/g.184 Transcript_127/m.184 type:complete len:187 (+) Transcript_127:48-608(+)
MIINRLTLLIIVSGYLVNSEMMSKSASATAFLPSTGKGGMRKTKSTSNYFTIFSDKRESLMLQQRQVKMVMNPHLNLNRGNTNINNDDTLDNTVHSTSLSSSAISLDSTTDVSDVSSSFTSDNNMNLVIPSVTGGIATADVNDQSLLSHIDQYQDILPLVDNNSRNKVVKNKERPLHKSLASTLVS